MYRLHPETFGQGHGGSNGCIWWHNQKLKQSDDPVEIWRGRNGWSCHWISKHAYNKANQFSFWKEVSLWLLQWELSSTAVPFFEALYPGIPLKVTNVIAICCPYCRLLLRGHFNWLKQMYLWLWLIYWRFIHKASLKKVCLFFFLFQ